MQNYEIVPESFVCTYCNTSLSYTVNEQDALQAATAEILKTQVKRNHGKEKHHLRKILAVDPQKRDLQQLMVQTVGKLEALAKLLQIKLLVAKTNRKEMYLYLPRNVGIEE